MVNKNNTKILVCCHKLDQWKSDDIYLPIQVGKANSEFDLGIQGDNTGDNISKKNKTFCELTGLYWAWKNLKDTEYIGLCHYRRYFNFGGKTPWFITGKQVNLNIFESNYLEFPKSKNILDKYDIILAKPRRTAYSLFMDYSRAHYSEDLRTVELIISEIYPEYILTFNDVIKESNKLSQFNMFFCRWEVFDAYCKWLFDILFEAERRINIDNYNPLQKRIFGYMAERLLNVYVAHHDLKVKYEPILFIEENPTSESNFNLLVSNVKSTLSYLIQKDIF